MRACADARHCTRGQVSEPDEWMRSEEHTSELQSPCNLVCRLLLEKKKKINNQPTTSHGLSPTKLRPFTTIFTSTPRSFSGSQLRASVSTHSSTFILTS